ncbi:MAG: KDO2-lipid IV(A) lauroyltransferase [Lysobacterales bacterium]|jgi:KDO2-lipid IV(A) lauroyltransferase
MGKVRIKYKKVILDRVITVFLYIMKWVLSYLPRWVSNIFITILTPVIYLFMGKHKDICLNNFKYAYGDSKTEAEIKYMMRRSILNISESMIDLLFYLKHLDKFDAVTRIHNEEYLVEILKKGKGVVATSAHLGNFSLMFVALARRGYKINVVIRPMRNQCLSKFMLNLADEVNVNMIQTVPQKNFLKETFGVLRNNEVLFVLLDEVIEEGGVEVDFFGNKVRRAIGPLMFNDRTGAPTLPIITVKDEEGFLNVHIEREVHLETKFSRDENAVHSISALTKVIESFVKKYPVQWGGWFNKRWGAKGKS